jgi:hypothetical protein
MVKRIAILTALIGMSGPAFGQMGAQLPSDIPDVFAHSVEAAQRSVYFADCERRYNTVRARSTMKPSDRKRALEVCRSIATNQAASAEVAQQQ